MKSQYERIGSWNKAAGSYQEGSEKIPLSAWPISILVIVIFFGVVPFVGFMAGYE